MSDTPDDIDWLLANHLRQQADSVDAETLRNRIRATIANEAVKPATTQPQRNWLRAAGWLVVVAAAILFASMTFLGGGSKQLVASPKALLQESQKAHHLPLDRCYLVEFQRTDEMSDESNPLAAVSRTTRLWTRGDRFWIESTNPRARWAWGRDENGTVWIAPGPRRGTRIDPNEAPRWLTFTCDICELRPEHLLGDLVRDFDLKREESPELNAATQVIRAELKPGHRSPGLKSAILELDSESKVLRRVVLNRAWPGRTVSTTYTLVETQTQSDDRYRLEGHLTGPFEIFSAENQPQRRREILAVLFGPRGVDWIRPFPKEGQK